MQKHLVSLNCQAPVQVQSVNYDGVPGHVTHEDGYSLYWPNGPEPSSFHHNNPAFKSLMQTMSDHMFRMAETDIPEAYLMADIAPVITLLECQPEQWIRWHKKYSFFHGFIKCLFQIDIPRSSRCLPLYCQCRRKCHSNPRGQTKGCKDNMIHLK